MYEITSCRIDATNLTSNAQWPFPSEDDIPYVGLYRSMPGLFSEVMIIRLQEDMGELIYVAALEGETTSGE